MGQWRGGLGREKVRGQGLAQQSISGKQHVGIQEAERLRSSSAKDAELPWYTRLVLTRCF